MDLDVRVVSQHPPGGRCTLYAGYADVLAAHLDARMEVVFSTERDAHGSGFPSLLVNGQAVQPADGVILMPADITAALAAHGMSEEAMTGLVEALEAPLERMLDAAG
jgi:cystathionine gamma-synthase